MIVARENVLDAHPDQREKCGASPRGRTPLIGDGVGVNRHAFDFEMITEREHSLRAKARNLQKGSELLREFFLDLFKQGKFLIELPKTEYPAFLRGTVKLPHRITADELTFHTTRVGFADHKPM